MWLPKYSMGVGDRFGHQGNAQLDAFLRAADEGVLVAPVWNKSHREHSIVGSHPADVRREADAAVAARSWRSPYFVDADHISMKTVEQFIPTSDFFTLDVADFIGAAPTDAALTTFVQRHQRYVGRLELPGANAELLITPATIAEAARRFLAAVEEAGRLFRHLEAAKGSDALVIEVSMDETDQPQTPGELFFILAGLAEAGVPVQTIAPRFSGRFNKGVDYVGDLGRFAREFEQDLAVVRLAVQQFRLPDNLKMSVHSGSDKFSIYRPMRAALRRFDAGIHLKTAGTTWLEELIGLAAAGGNGLEIAKEIYAAAFSRFEELAAPYAAVIDIRPAALPSPASVASWPGEEFAAALRHDQACEAYNPNFRQLLHVSYKVAAEMGDRFRRALAEHAETIAAGVTDNIYRRHLRPLFFDDEG